MCYLAQKTTEAEKLTLKKQKQNQIFDLLSRSTSKVFLFNLLSKEGKLMVSQLLLQAGDRNKLPTTLGIFESLVGKKATKETTTFLRQNIDKLSDVFCNSICVTYFVSTSKLLSCLRDVSPAYADVISVNKHVFDIADVMVKREKPGAIVLVIREGQVSVHGVQKLRQAVAVGTRAVTCLVYDFDGGTELRSPAPENVFSSLQDLMEVVAASPEILNPAFKLTENGLAILPTAYDDQLSTFKAMYKASRCLPITSRDVFGRSPVNTIWCSLRHVCPKCYVRGYVIPLERFRRETGSLLFFRDDMCDQVNSGDEFRLLHERADALFKSDLWTKAVKPIKAAVLPVYRQGGAAVVRSIILVNKNEHRIFRNLMLKEWTEADGPADYTAYSNFLITGMWKHDPVCWQRHKAFADNLPYPRLMRARNANRSS